MDSLITILIIIAAVTIVVMLVKGIARLALIAVVGFLIFNIFFGGGQEYVTKVASYFSDDIAVKIEEFYTEFRTRSDENSPLDTQAAIDSMVEYVNGKIDIETLKADIESFASENLTFAKLEEFIILFEVALETETLTEELVLFIENNFNEETAQALIDKIQSYIISQDSTTTSSISHEIAVN
jgi:hypothetical protein